MKAIIKALGVTIWGLIAIGLLAIFVFVGFEAGVKLHASRGTLIDEGTSGNRPDARPSGFSSGVDSSAPVSRANDPSDASSSSAPERTRKLFRYAVRNRDYESAIAYGHQLVDEKSDMAPGDLSTIAQSYASIGDCENARLWANKAQDAFQTAGMVHDGSLRRAISCCGTGLRHYELAIASIERGLRKGSVVHLDEAYVYLGLSKQAIGDIAGAREAFGELKDVPGISPRVLRLWTLYAETQLTGAESWTCTKVE